MTPTPTHGDLYTTGAGIHGTEKKPDTALSPQEELGGVFDVETSNLICGVDMGGRRARLCFLDPTDTRQPIMVRFEPMRTELWNRSYVDVARWVAATVPSVWAKARPQVVWLEEPRGQSQRAVHQLSVMCGVLLCGLPRTVPVDMVTAGECRKLVGLKANCGKSATIEWATVETDADFVFDDHDADAYVVARAILAHGERRPQK